MRYLFLSILIGAAAWAASPAVSIKPYFHKDIAPILQARCQGCHRPGEAAPMSLLTYSQTRPWAKAIKQAVSARKMPPWFADPHVGKFSNDRRLTQNEIDTVAAWVDAGAPEGNIKDSPKPVQWVEGWEIGKPDMVFEMLQEFAVAEKGTLEYQYVVLPTGLTDDKWVQAAEARPGNRAVVHHIIAFIREPGSKWLKDATPGVPFIPPPGKGRDVMADDNLAGYAPGSPASILKPGQGRLLKAGSDIVLQMHYTANGKAQTDRSRVGVIFAKQQPKERVLTLAAGTTKFVIPAGDANYRVDASMTLHARSTLVSLLPHMHLRGKSFSYRLTYPDGKVEDVLSVPRYDFNWQLWYLPAEEKVLPAGTKIECTAYFDNSANNPFNPDPKAEVRWGEQSWEEMMFGFFDLAIDVSMDKKDLFRPQRAPQSSAARTGE